MIRDALATWWLLRDARLSSRRPAVWFRRRQETMLRRLLNHAYQRVPLYRRLYDDAGFRPDAFRTLEDLDRVPTLSKAILKAADPAETIAVGTDRASCTVDATSGSTGVPMQITFGRHETRWRRAVAWRILFEHGFRWTDRTLEIRFERGTTFLPQRFGIAPKDTLSILDPPESWAACLTSRRHACVVASAGMLDMLAAAVDRPGSRPPRLVISDSETLTPQARARIAAALGTAPVDVYGLEEVSNFAWECEHRAGMHVSADSHIVEVVAPPGSVGPLIVTALGMWTMPFIRYETGDLAEMAGAPCPCGRTLPRLAALHGRAMESIELDGGRHLLWPFFYAILGAEPEILQWQVVQTAPCDILVRIVPRRDGPRLVDRVAASLRSQLPPAARIVVRSEKVIPGEANGKRRLIIPLQR
jgi:phenylacetate-CoA ligase